MSEGLLSAVGSIIDAAQKKFYGIAIGTVSDTLDPLGQGRVKVKLPWFNENENTGWARIATPVAGSNYGFYFIPRVDEEVLVAFEHGDIELPYIIGRLWNLQDQPPEFTPLLGKSHIRTFAGHDVTFDDIQQSIEISTSTLQKITLDPFKIEMSNASGTVTLTLDNTSQKITLQAAVGIELKAIDIKIEGVNVEINGTAKTEVKSAGLCNVQAPLVKIN
jgi:phage baseplate assembly protein gpV